MVLTVHTVKMGGLAVAIPAAVITIIRVFVRARMRNLGLDDAFAMFALVGLLVLYVSLFFLFDLRPLPPLPHHSGTPTARYIMYYMAAQSFYWVIWSARLSLLFMIIRITPPYTGARRALYFFAWGFAVAWVVLAAQLIWICEKKATWKMASSPQCPLGSPVAIAQLTSDILADSILVIAPLRLLRHLDNNFPERRRLLFVFSSSIVTTITSLIHAYYILRVGGLIVVFTALIEVSSSLLVCNLAIIVSLVCRIFGCGGSYSPQRTADFSLDLRSHPNRDAFGQGSSLAFQHDPGTVIHVELDTHPHTHGKADTEASLLSTTKPDVDAATDCQKAGLSRTE